MLIQMMCITSRARADTPTPVVMLAPRAHHDLSSRTAEAVAAQLADLPVSFTVEWVVDLPLDMRSQVDAARQLTVQRNATAVFWVDLSMPEQLFLYIAEPHGGRILVRSIRAVGEGTEARLETVAVIIRGAVKAILAGGKIGVEVPAPPPEKPEGPSHRLDAFLSYILVLYSLEQVTLHGARLGLSARLAGWGRAYLAYRIQLPLRAENRYVELELSPHPWEFGLSGRPQFGAWYIEAGAGLTIDIVTVEVAPRDDNLTTRSVEHFWLFGLTPSIAIGRSLGKIASIYLAVSTDITLNERWYAVQTPEGSQSVLKPWKVRPVFRFGGLFSLL